MECGILVPPPGIDPALCAVETESYPLDHQESPRILFIFKNWNSIPIKQQLPSPPYLQPLATTIEFSMYLATLDTLYGLPWWLRW